MCYIFKTFIYFLCCCLLIQPFLHFYFSFKFTFMHLVITFIQSELHCISPCIPWEVLYCAYWKACILYDFCAVNCSECIWNSLFVWFSRPSGFIFRCNTFQIRVGPNNGQNSSLALGILIALVTQWLRLEQFFFPPSIYPVFSPLKGRRPIK